MKLFGIDASLTLKNIIHILVLTKFKHREQILYTHTEWREYIQSLLAAVSHILDYEVICANSFLQFEHHLGCKG